MLGLMHTDIYECCIILYVSFFMYDCIILYSSQISEGTPSPSALPMVPPDFSARKTLSYDETSQDAPNTSFEGERGVVVKTEPEPVTCTETDSKVTEDPNNSVILITESPVKTKTHAIKEEPMDTTDSAIVDKEFNDTSTADQTAAPAIVKKELEAGESDSAGSQVDTISGTIEVKKEIESGGGVAEEENVEKTDSITKIPSQDSSKSDTETHVTVKEERVAMATDDSEVPVPEPVIATIKAVADLPKSPATQGSGGSTPVQDERSATPVKALEDCPGTPVQDEPLVE